MIHIKLFQVNKNILLIFALVLFLIFFFANCSQKSPHEKFAPPLAKKIPEKITLHGHTRVDDYSWLQDPGNPEVIAYLEAENAYGEKVMAHTEALQETIFQEIKGRVKETDLTVPERRGDYFYYERTEEGKEYPIYARKFGSIEAAEEIMLDVNELAPDEGHFGLGLLTVSPNQDILAFLSGTDPRTIGTIRFKNLSTGKMLDDTITGIKARPLIMCWANDNRTLFYLGNDAESGRFHSSVYRHTLGSDSSEDVEVYKEQESRNVWLSRTKSQKYIIIKTGADFALPGWEHRYLEADKPFSEPRLFIHREWNVLRGVDQLNGHFYFLASDDNVNRRLFRAPVDNTGKDQWEEVIPYREDVEVVEIQLFRDYLVVMERIDGLPQFRIHRRSGDEDSYVDFGEPTYMVALKENPDFDSEVFRYSYWSFTTPHSLYEYNMRTGEKVLLKQTEVSESFKSEDYISERLFASSRDGVRIPISLVYKKGLKKDGSHPLLLTGYGAYGYPTWPVFSVERSSLLDRGFVCAIAHVRGGGILGLQWHTDGMKLKKKNTFYDFIDVAEYLIAQKYTNPKRLFATGRSAGGLLMGAVANMRPDLFKGIIAAIPLVALLPPPQDRGDYKYESEFGYPSIKEQYFYLLSYSPYENVETKHYPNMLVITALNDANVPYRGPAKWVAKLRALKTGDNRIILKTDMEGGHARDQRRSKQWRDIALEYAFLLDLAGIEE